MRSKPGFTLIELSVVLFILGLLLWLVAPRLSAVLEPGRDTVFREIAAGSEAAFDAALFEKREVRLVLNPSAGTFLFRTLGNDRDEPPPREFGKRLAITGIRIGNEDRLLDIVTEIRYLPGGRVPETRLFVRDSGTVGEPTDWTLRIDPVDGSVDVSEGRSVSWQ